MQRCTKKSSQFQAIKYVQAEKMCTDAPKNLASFKKIKYAKKNDVERCTKKSSQFQAEKYVQAKTMCSDAPENLASFKQ